MQLTATIQKHKNDWYICRIKMTSGQIACGYGTTHTKALQDAFRDMKIIEKLQCKN